MTTPTTPPESPTVLIPSQLAQAEHELAEMRAHGNADDVVEAAAHLERVIAPINLPPLPKGYAVHMSPNPDELPFIWFDEHDMHEYALAAIRAYAESLAPAGWKVVPVEPTQAMKDAGSFSLNMNHVLPDLGLQALYVYRAMLAASPSPEGEGA